MQGVHIGQLIKEIAKEKRLTDEEIAERLNVHRNTINRTYSEKLPNTDKLLQLCEVLQYDFFKHLSDSLTFKGNVFNQVLEPKEHYETPLGSSMDSIVSVTLTLPKEKQKEILKLIFSA